MKGVIKRSNAGLPKILGVLIIPDSQSTKYGFVLNPTVMTFLDIY